LLQYLSESGKTVEGHFSGLRKVFSTPELGIECADNLKFRVVENVKEYFLKKYPKSITIDGIRIVQDDGWGLVRASNTQPKIILRFEAKSERALERIQKEVADAVNAEIGDAK
jgi:phosphomannomutase/phosphoglucomutase